MLSEFGLGCVVCGSLIWDRDSIVRTLLGWETLVDAVECEARSLAEWAEALRFGRAGNGSVEWASAMLDALETEGNAIREAFRRYIDEMGGES
jgi:hypothetical protein